MNLPRSHFAATTAAVLLWSASFIATKIAYTDFSPMMLGFARFFVAAIVLGVIRASGSDSSPAPKGRELRAVAWSAFLGITLYFAAENVGVQLTSAGNAALIVASYPAITALLEFFVCNVRPCPQKMLGIILAVAGVAVLTPGGTGGEDNTLAGNVLLVAAGVVWAGYNFSVRSLSEKYSPLTLSYYQMLFGTIFFLPLAWAEHDAVRSISFAGGAALVYLSLGCSVAAFMLYNFGLRKLAASTAISLMNLVPVVGLLLSAVILRESVSMQQIFGGIVVMLGVALSVRERPTETQTAS